MAGKAVPGRSAPARRSRRREAWCWRFISAAWPCSTGAFSRVEVPAPGSFLVARPHRWGDRPARKAQTYSDSDILAPGRELYKERHARRVAGRALHFLNPFFWSYGDSPRWLDRAAGKPRWILTALYVRTADPAGAAGGRRVPRRRRRARHRRRSAATRQLPHQPLRLRAWKLEDAVEVECFRRGRRADSQGRQGYHGRICRSTLGRSPYVVPEGYRGVQEKPLSSGTYYVNPYVKNIARVDTRSHQAEFTDIEFPSKDGFHIKPHVSRDVPGDGRARRRRLVHVTLSDNGELPQGDERRRSDREEPRSCRRLCCR